MLFHQSLCLPKRNGGFVLVRALRECQALQYLGDGFTPLVTHAPLLSNSVQIGIDAGSICAGANWSFAACRVFPQMAWYVAWLSLPMRKQ
jgi:hypothetical protein